MALCLGDLLDDPVLGLEMAAGSDADRDRRVRGVHSIEIEAPTAWLERDWIMLTVGLRLRRNVRAQRQVIAELSESGMAALGFGVEICFERIPEAMLDEAERRAFPVFKVPLQTTFGQLEALVHRSLLSSDLGRFRRLTAMQHHLLDSYGDEQPHETVIKRLARLVGGSVAVLGAGGSVERGFGEGPWEAIWGEIVSRPRTVLEFDAGSSYAVAVPIGVGVTPRWLVVTRPERPIGDDLTKPLAQIAAPLIAALTRLEETGKRQARATRAAIFEALLKDGSELERRALSKQLSTYGFRPDHPWRVLVIDHAANDPHAASARAAAAQGAGLAPAFERCRFPHLLGEPAAQTAALVQAPTETLKAVLESVLRSGAVPPDAVVGVGRCCGIDNITHSWRDAGLIVDRLRTGEGPRLQFYEDIDLDILLISEADLSRLGAKVKEISAMVDARDGLREAVGAYFRNDLNVRRAASELGLHQNSVRYRLRVLEDLLGRPLRSPIAITIVSLALTAEAQMRDRPPSPNQTP